ncbi:aconitate hydratase AcnA [Saccharopolyspora hirsuta]|uniref:Aconitate hydratase n=1 Tax=Saccharopolyspora hirsuta TaxID=1837 RepID=A0A5M7CA55_SACHI|nr:aconitate hydratase AcnA [Saccharopolyspora hirsuta]KAA5835235.1 aconitate hydratase AcnA [Saccharopolyspora hirsuta]
MDVTASQVATAELALGGRRFRYLPLARLLPADELRELPFVTRILLENVARRAPGTLPAVIGRVRGGADCELPVHPNRIMLHDTTCLPALADFAGMRDAVAELGGDPAAVGPAIPADLTVDHSVIVEEYGTPQALENNLRIDFRRNRERYEFIKWAQGSLQNFRVVPPATGIIHQINMESLARVVWDDEGLLHPDLLVATDSHTPMINALGVLGWGVGGLQAQAAMLGEPVVIRFPEVLGVRLEGRLRGGVTATDLALTITEKLRAHGVVDKFVEFTGPGIAALGWAARAAVSNMAPEYGATCAFFPFDDETARYLELTARTREHRGLVAGYLRAQGLYRDDETPSPRYDEELVLDLDAVEPSLAGPRLPHQRVPLSQVPASFRAESGGRPAESDAFGEPVPAGAVAIASITSCTNTANPDLMVRAGLLARRAVERGLDVKPWVKTSLSPGSRVVADYLRRAGLLEPLSAIGFDIAGFGCMTCIGNSGALHPGIADLVERGFEPVAVVSGNRNFGGRLNPQVSLAYLASPPLVVAYALAGTVLHDFDTPLGRDVDGEPVLLSEIWPSDGEVARVVAESVSPEMFAANTASLRNGTVHWRELPDRGGVRFAWDPESTYIRRPPYLVGLSAEPEKQSAITGARVLLRLGDDVTTDHISPAGAIPKDSAAGDYLRERGVLPSEFNQYSTRRSNHEVMVRGAFTNPTVRNELLDVEQRGALARTADGSRVLPVHQAAPTYRDAGVPLVVVAGRNYGAGSSRDWAAKAQALLGVRAVIAESFERIHRSNLIGMGVLPLRLPDGLTAEGLDLTGREELDLTGLDRLRVGTNAVHLDLNRADGSTDRIELELRLDTRNEVSYLEHGGTLPYVVRRVLG